MRDGVEKLVDRVCPNQSGIGCLRTCVPEPWVEAVIDLMCGIVHDFNNVLGIISGNTEIALEERGDKTDSVTFCLEQVLAASGRGALLLDQLYEVANGIHEGKMAVLMHLLVKQVAKVVERELPKHIKLALKMHTNTARVEINLNAVHAGLSALLREGVAKLSEQGGVIHVLLDEINRMTASCDDASESDTRYVRLSVSLVPADRAAQKIDATFLCLTNEYGYVDTVLSHGGIIEVKRKEGAVNVSTFLPVIEAL